MGTGTGTGDRDGQCQTDVSDKNGQRQTDVSDRETDSFGRTCRTGTDKVRRTCRTGTGNIRCTCRTERRTASDGRVGQRWAALDERRRYGDTETEEMEARLIFRIEYKRLHEEKKKRKHGRRPPYIHSSCNSHTSSYSYPRNSHMYSYSHMCS